MKAQEILKSYWGYDDFRPLQADIISSILSGKDSLALLPTGGGKSICYQVPALMQEGICLVISPLLSLMSDQVEQLKDRKIKAIAINSFLSKRQIDQQLDNAVYGDFKLLYVSPERLQTDLFRERLKKMKVSFIAVDEAHCISQWGYDFRPSYLQINEVREILPDCPVLALTATATETVVQDIQEKLGFEEENIFRRSYKRENLAFKVVEMEDKRTNLVRSLKSLDGSSIVYARNRRLCRELSDLLSGHGISTSYYHAGLDREERLKRQKEWTASADRSIVATNAFGMGIDKADVRLIVHMDLPDSLEAYYQEAGRAGRDGKESEAVVYFSQIDVDNLKSNSERSFPSEESLSALYDKLCNHLQIARGEGKDQIHSLDLEELSEKSGLKIRDLYNHLKQLQHEGYLELSEGSEMGTKVFIKASHQAVMQESQPSMREMLDLLLRAYSGVFDEYTPISLRRIADQLGISIDEVKSRLQYLEKLDYIDLQLSTDLPMLNFLKARPDRSAFQLTSMYEKRKNAHFQRVDSVLNFVRQQEICRMQFILEYFGETNTEACGKCDVCLGMHRSLTLSETEELQKAVLQLLQQKKKMDVRDVVETLSQYPRESVVEAGRQLMDKGLIRSEGTILYLN